MVTVYYVTMLPKCWVLLLKSIVIFTLMSRQCLIMFILYVSYLLLLLNCSSFVLNFRAILEKKFCSSILVKMTFRMIIGSRNFKGLVGCAIQLFENPAKTQSVFNNPLVINHQHRLLNKFLTNSINY